MSALANEPRLARLAEAVRSLLGAAPPVSLLGGFRPRDGAVVLQGRPGAGRRRLAWTVAAELRRAGELPGGAVVLPASASRVRVVQRQVIAGRGRPPPALGDATALTAAYRAALADLPGPGLAILDARYGAETAVLDALAPPAGWRSLVLVPAGADRLIPGGLDVALPAPDGGGEGGGAAAVRALRARAPAHDALLAAAAYVDPWEGAPRARLLALAGLGGGAAAEDASDAAIVDALAVRALIAVGDDRLAPSLHLVVARPHGAARGDRERAIERRLLSAMAALARPAAADERARFALWAERGNVVTTLAVLRDVVADDRAAAAEHVRALEGLLGVLLPDPTAHGAATFLIDQLTAASPDPDLRYRIELYRQMLG